MADIFKVKRDRLEFAGATMFRQRLICATLSQRSIVIKDIRADDEQLGLRDYEASFLRLLEKITNGCRIRINETGTEVQYVPGFISGGSNLKHECPPSRGIGYFLEALICLAPFGKAPLSITLTGVTNNATDISPDIMRTVTLPLLANFGIDAGLELKIVRRGLPPLGGGLVEFKCPNVKTLSPIMLLDEGLIRRIRGIAFSARVSPQTCQRVVTAAREYLNQVVADVFIYTDHYKGNDAGLSPGFGIALVCESTSNALLSVEACANPSELPEDFGKRAALLLLDEVARRGVCDTTNQSLLLLFMVLCQEDVSRLRIGKISPYTIQYLRHLKDFFGVTFKIDADVTTDTIVMTCLGVGFENLSRPMK